MKILIGDKGHYDFDGPILMSSEQQQDFEKMMRELFTVIQIEQGKQFRVDRLGDKIFARTWTRDELRCLLDINDINTVCKELGRSWMSVDIKRGEFIPDFMLWAHMMGRDIIQGDTKSLIEEYLKARELEKQKRKDEKKLKNTFVKTLKREMDNLHKKQESIYQRRLVGLINPRDEKVLSKIVGQLSDIEKKIKQTELHDKID
jgi:hypothetical protein